MAKSTDTTVFPTVEINEIVDPAEANRGMELINQDLVQLQSIPMQARRVIVRLDDCALVGYTTNLRVRTRPVVGDYCVFITFSPEARGTVEGLQIRSDICVAVSPNSSPCIVAEPSYESISFLIRPQALSYHMGIRDLEGKFNMPNGVVALNVDSSFSVGLFQWGKNLLSTALDNPEFFDSCKIQREAVQIDLIDTLLSSLCSTQRLEPERKERTKQIQSDIVRSAERYALSHMEDRLYVTDLCRAAGVSERTLEYAFSSVMGLRPTAYLTRIRLHRVRQSLMMARPGSTTVTAEALNWGFWHFGEFSKAYRECFNELPSDTLKRNSSLTDI